jgi:phenylpyruvate tautomerase PptA (4-oxalocrotonate tautomerase family)
VRRVRDNELNELKSSPGGIETREGADIHLIRRTSMPIARISVRRGWTGEDKAALLEAVHSAMVEALKIPERDRNQRLDEYEPENFIVPPGRTDRFALVEITLFAGRSLDAKRNLYAQIVKRVGRLGVDPMDVFIVLYEPPLENWGIRGGIPASEVDLGFKVDV